MSLFSGGARTCPMRYWHWAWDKSEMLRFLSGAWDVSQGPEEGGQWQFCPEDAQKMSIQP